jgi:hypothetical protein
MKCDTIMEQKTIELSRFLTLKSRIVDFAEPTPALQRDDSRELRARILALTSADAKRLGIGRSTFHYLRKRTISHGQTRVYAKTLRRIALLSASVLPNASK